MCCSDRVVWDNKCNKVTKNCYLSLFSFIYFAIKLFLYVTWVSGKCMFSAWFYLVSIPSPSFYSLSYFSCQEEICDQSWYVEAQPDRTTVIPSVIVFHQLDLCLATKLQTDVWNISRRHTLPFCAAETLIMNSAWEGWRGGWGGRKRRTGRCGGRCEEGSSRSAFSSILHFWKIFSFFFACCSFSSCLSSSYMWWEPCPAPIQPPSSSPLRLLSFSAPPPPFLHYIQIWKT